MTIAVEEPTPVAGMAAPAHPALTALDDAISQVSVAADTAIWGLSDEGITGAVERCERMRAGLHSFLLSLVREADGRILGRRSGAASTAAWLTGRFRIRPGQARAWVQLANSVAEPDEVTDYAANSSGPRTGRELVETGQALAAGQISPEHAAVVDKIMAKVPREVEVERASQAEADLAGYCRKFDPATVAKLGDYMLELMREETLDDEEGDRYRRRNLRLDDHTGGISGQLTREGMAMLRSALDQLAAPNPAADGTPDERSAGQRLADALVELARRAIASDEFASNHGISHRVMVMIGLESLTNQSDTETGGRGQPAGPTVDGEGNTGHGTRSDEPPPSERNTTPGDSDSDNEPDDGDVDNDHDVSAEDSFFGDANSTRSVKFGPGRYPRWATRRTGAAPAEQEWGSLISASTARRLACHASVQRIVLDPAGAVLDVGRDYRTVTPAQFAALIARDGGCAFPGCTRPPAWVHRASHQTLDQRRRDEPGQSRAAVRVPPSGRTPQRLGRCDQHRPAADLLPASMGRPRPRTQTQQPAAPGDARSLADPPVRGGAPSLGSDGAPPHRHVWDQIFGTRKPDLATT
jgi:hypothetical protein